MNGHVPCQDPLAELCGQFEVAVYIQKRESRHTPVASKEHQFKGTPAVVVWQTMFVHGRIVHWGMERNPRYSIIMYLGVNSARGDWGNIRWKVSKDGKQVSMMGAVLP